jgi:hypothetical protein
MANGDYYGNVGGSGSPSLGCVPVGGGAAASVPGSINYFPLTAGLVLAQAPGGEQHILRTVDPRELGIKIPDPRPVPKDVEKDIQRIQIPGWARSAVDHAGQQAILHGKLRDLYHAADAAIQREALKMLVEGRSLREIADWRTNARNELKTLYRRQGNMLVDAFCRATRKEWDKPSPDLLRRGAPARGKLPKTDLQIIRSGTNRGVDVVAEGLKIGGRVAIAIDVGVGAFRVISAPPGQRFQTAVTESGRIGGALAGGWAGFKSGAYIGGLIGSFFGPAYGTVIGAGIGGLIGGFGGAFVGGWLGETGAKSLF